MNTCERFFYSLDCLYHFGSLSDCAITWERFLTRVGSSVCQQFTISLKYFRALITWVKFLASMNSLMPDKKLVRNLSHLSSALKHLRKEVI